MPTKTETVVNNFKINYLSTELFNQALANGEIEQNEVYMTPDADIQVPTKVSELENDSGFITSTDIANKLDKNGNGSNVTVSFTTASSRTNISSGESMATIASKASKYFTDLKGVSFTGSYNDLNNKPSNATTTSDGFQSSDDKLKLDGIEAGANKTIIDSVLSDTSTNPVQNKVIKTRIDAVEARIDTITEGADEALDTFKEVKDYLANHQTEYEALAAISSNKVDKIDGMGLSSNDYTTAEKNKLNGIAAGAEVNQNAFSNIAIGSDTIRATGETDTLTMMAGDNVTLTVDTATKKVTFSSKDTTYGVATQTVAGIMSTDDKKKLDGIETGATKYVHPTYNAYASGMYKFEVDDEGHIISATSIVKDDITRLGIPAQDTTYSLATTTTSGLMSPEDKTKLDEISYATDEDILALFA